MNSSDTDFDSIMICLEQKNIFITDLLNTTKQIEVQSRQDDVQINDLLDQRQTKIDRMKKCDELIDEKLKLLNNEQKEIWYKIINGEQYNPKNETEKKALEFVNNIRQIAKRTAEIDKIATKNLKNKYEEVKKNLTDLRKNKVKSSNIFNV